jgi:hypothetical protein
VSPTRSLLCFNLLKRLLNLFNFYSLLTRNALSSSLNHIHPSINSSVQSGSVINQQFSSKVFRTPVQHLFSF